MADQHADTVAPSRHTFGSMFAGIGGLDLGLERAGWACRWQVEKDPYCRRVLADHWPAVTRYEDTREVEWSGVERVDLVAAGFPCQPVSQSGLRLAQDDPRWLWPEVERAVRILRPRLVLLENVPGLFTAGFDDVLSDLAALGFDAEWSVLSACTVGAPQMRRRLFLVAYAPGEGLQGLDVQRLAEPVRPASGTVWRGWPPEPEVARMADGIPRRLVLDPVRALGNAVVPQVAELIGAALIDGVDRES